MTVTIDRKGCLTIYRVNKGPPVNRLRERGEREEGREIEGRGEIVYVCGERERERGRNQVDKMAS